MIGTGTAVTPVLSAPLSGPAYLVSHGGAAYPDVVFVLQGDGVNDRPTGGDGHQKGDRLLDVRNASPTPRSPRSKAVLPEGPHAVFGANLPAKAKGSFCGRAPSIATTLEGQNAAVYKESIKLDRHRLPPSQSGQSARQETQGNGARHKK